MDYPLAIPARSLSVWEAIGLRFLSGNIGDLGACGYQELQ